MQGLVHNMVFLERMLIFSFIRYCVFEGRISPGEIARLEFVFNVASWCKKGQRGGGALQLGFFCQ